MFSSYFGANYTLDEEKSTNHFYFSKGTKHDQIKYLGAVFPNQLIYSVQEIDDIYIELWGGELTKESYEIVSNTNIFYPRSPNLYTNTIETNILW